MGETAILMAALLAPLDATPPLSDRDRFPPREVVRQAMQFNQAFAAHCLLQMQFYQSDKDRWGYWAQAYSETRYLFHCYDWLHAAQGGEGRDETYWRTSLCHLREMIGRDMYSAGTMPPCVPFRYFYYVD